MKEPRVTQKLAKICPIINDDLLPGELKPRAVHNLCVCVCVYVLALLQFINSAVASKYIQFSRGRAKNQQHQL